MSEQGMFVKCGVTSKTEVKRFEGLLNAEGEEGEFCLAPRPNAGSKGFL